jgi:DNA-binding IclR family transcriptional regulator
MYHSYEVRTMLGEHSRRSNQDSGTLSTVSTAFEVIETVSEREGMGVAELAAELDLPTSTAHVYLKTLASLGYLINRDGEYRASYRLLGLGGSIRDRVDLVHITKPKLYELAAESGELAHLGVEEVGRLVLLHKTEIPESVDDNAHIGQYVPMHCTAMGKAILAYLPRSRVDEIVEEYGLEEFTVNTIVAPRELDRELDSIRDRGLAINTEERTRGVRAVATPLLDNANDVVGAISISGPAARMSTERMYGDLADLLSEARNVIELRMTHY